MSDARSTIPFHFSLATGMNPRAAFEGVSRMNRVSLGVVLCAVMLAAGGTPGFCSGQRSELIQAYAMGTGSQIGERLIITLNIDRYSPPEDRRILAQALQAGGNDGLADTLSKLKPVGRFTISGNPGYDVTYIHVEQTATGRKLQFVARRQLKFREAYHDKRTAPYDLTAGEFNLNDTDKAASTGFLYPETRISLDEKGKVRFDLAGNPYILRSVVDFKGTPGMN